MTPSSSVKATAHFALLDELGLAHVVLTAEALECGPLGLAGSLDGRPALQESQKNKLSSSLTH